MRQKIIVSLAIILVVTLSAFTQTHVYGKNKNVYCCLIAGTVNASSSSFNCGRAGTWSGIEDYYGIITPLAGTLSHFYIRMQTAQPASGNLVCTIWTNSNATGAGTASTVSITIPAAGAAQIASDLTHKVNVNAGDRIYLQCINNATAASAYVRTAGWYIE